MRSRYQVGQRFRDRDGDTAVIEKIDGSEITFSYPNKPNLDTIPWYTDTEADYFTALVPLTTANKEHSDTVSTREQDINEAKFDLAVEHGLRAKFNYTNEQGETHDVRLEPDDVWRSDEGNVLVGGDSYDEDGRFEGYKQYRLDRVNGPAAIR